MADDHPPTRVPPALVDFGKALGRDVPASLKRTQAVAAQIRARGSAKVKKGGK